MLPLPVFRHILYIAAGLVLALAGCRSSALVPTFPSIAGSRPPRPTPHLDTATADTAPEYPTTPQRRVKTDVRPPVAGAQDHVPRKQKEPAGKLGRSHAEPTTGDTTSSATQPVASHEPRKPSPPKLLSVQTLVHYSLHFVFPAVLALVLFPLMWQGAYLIMLATMLMDLDHLLATPVFDPLRCSVGYHPLHSFYAVPVYALFLLLPATQIVAVGLLFHLFTDTVDCLWSFRHCHECYLNSRIRGLLDWVRKPLA